MNMIATVTEPNQPVKHYKLDHESPKSGDGNINVISTIIGDS